MRERRNPIHSMKNYWGEYASEGGCPCSLSKFSSMKKPYDSPSPAFPEPLNMRSPIREITGQMISGIQTEHERLVIDAFAAYGYTKDWIVGNVHRVRARTLPMTLDCVVKTVYSVDRCDLFVISDKVEYSVCPGDQLKANITTSVRYIKSFEEENES